MSEAEHDAAGVGAFSRRVLAEQQRRIGAAQAEAEAARYAEAHGLAADDGPPDPARVTSAEQVRLFGGAEHASKVVQNLPAWGGVRSITYAEQAEQRDRMRAFWRNGGGRFPAEYQPQPPPPDRARSARYPAEWLNDPDCR